MVFDAERLPRFSGSRLEVTQQVMNAVHELVSRTIPDERWIRERYLRRSIGEVIDDGYTLAYGPCLDRTLVTTALLGAHGIDSYVLLKEMPSGMTHAIQEVQLEDSSWIWLDYTKDESHLFCGRFQYVRIPGRAPRFIRMRAPEFGPKIWYRRPHLKLISGMGAPLSARYDWYCKVRSDFLEQLRLGKFSLEDQLVQNPFESMWADLWCKGPVVGADYDEERYTDLSYMRLYLESAAPAGPEHGQ